MESLHIFMWVEERKRFFWLWDKREHSAVPVRESERLSAACAWFQGSLALTPPGRPMSSVVSTGFPPLARVAPRPQTSAGRQI